MANAPTHHVTHPTLGSADITIDPQYSSRLGDDDAAGAKARSHVASTASYALVPRSQRTPGRAGPFLEYEDIRLSPYDPTLHPDYGNEPVNTGPGGVVLD